MMMMMCCMMGGFVLGMQTHYTAQLNMQIINTPR